jgi:hypothetical protein
VSRVQWVSPSPLWDDLLRPGTAAAFRAPALLRFATDEFMEAFQASLAASPAALRGVVARPETWRRPAAGLPATDAPAEAGSAAQEGAAEVLKLYQPAHGRFYLVAASLACRVPGLPEHTVHFDEGESVSFVLRRLADDGELAWVAGAAGAAGWTGAPEAELAPGEERLPMFASHYAADGLTRRVFAGLVPVGRREAYVGGRTVTPAGAEPEAPTGAEDPRRLAFQRDVVDPWAGLVEWRDTQKGGTVKLRTSADAAAEQASALLLLDFADWLREHLDPVWRAIQPGASEDLTDAQSTLATTLLGTPVRRRSGAAGTLAGALRAAVSRRDDIEGLSLAQGSATVPPGLVPVLLTGLPLAATSGPSGTAAADHALEQPLLGLIRRAAVPATIPAEQRPRPIVEQVAAALPPAPAPEPEGGAASEAPRAPTLAPLNAQGNDRYVIRCVYLRPRCGRGYPPALSEPTEPFRLASFFDPDAPQRPIRVALPVDTTPAGLRKFDRNVAFLLSDELRRQMSRVKGLKELMDGEVDEPKPGLDLSVICSLSIPIITICALILLMIVVSLLNFIFRWIPFFVMCFPVPSLKAKE